MAESKAFRCRLITPAAQVLDQDVVYASVPAWDGLFGVLPGRAPIVARLGPGELRLDFADDRGGKGGSRSFVVDEGFVQMVGNKLTVLAKRAEPAEELVEATIKAELDAAQRSGDGSDRSARERRFAEAKLRVAGRRRGTGI